METEKIQQLLREKAELLAKVANDLLEAANSIGCTKTE